MTRVEHGERGLPVSAGGLTRARTFAGKRRPGTHGRKTRYVLHRSFDYKAEEIVDAYHFGWIFPAWLLISPILFAFIPAGTSHTELGRSNVVGRSDLGPP
jgi:hypothetical protein